MVEIRNDSKLKELISVGAMDSFLLQIAEADISVRDTADLLAQAAVDAAKRKEVQSKIVAASAAGVEHLVPNAGRVESEQADKLLQLAKKLSASRTSR